MEPMGKIHCPVLCFGVLFLTFEPIRIESFTVPSERLTMVKQRADMLQYSAAYCLRRSYTL